MLVKELIEKLKKFNPDGNAEVIGQFDDSDFFDELVKVSMEEDDDKNLVVILHTTER